MSQPNFVFIMSDDHAARAISAYGSGLNSTPNLDRIAERTGLSFRFVHADSYQGALDLVAAGKSNRAISEELTISVRTTSVHVSHILAKLGAASRTEAAAWAYANGG